MTTDTIDPDLAMTDQEVAAILATAQAESEQAAAAVQDAERAVRGELPGGQDVTPAKLAKLRDDAEHAAMRVQAAEKRTREITEKRTEARKAEIRARIREEAAGDLDRAEDIIAALDGFEAALSGLCEAMEAHNDRIARWAREMSAAGVPASHGEAPSAYGLGHEIHGGSLTIDNKIYRPLVAGKYVAATLYRVMSPYPRAFLKAYHDQAITDKGDWIERTEVDLHARIRRDA
ncbi:hypothetical protein HTZ77_18565 [Nonomuraea sp. SMC257]|uniref:Uncharacterized protein n=1 Tax=Nonomuraea montanisoli TaxID=2741721 RepID=A0A7Y6I806_9ACTN|nr:hypothetical protein [Nonomuraea montanisoli]NUW33418.1 hypothetical protein [Nonomuraea montanisoli]